MTASLETNILLDPRVHPAEVLGRLRLTAGKAAEICGVTRRQLCYWTDKGIIPCCNPHGRGAARRIYDFHGLRKALMLKRLIDEGRGLRRAVRELKARWVDPPAAPPTDARLTEEHALLAQAERLTRLGQQVRETGERAPTREALVRLALALQPLAQLSQAAAEGRVSLAGADRARNLGGLLSHAEAVLKHRG